MGKERAGLSEYKLPSLYLLLQCVINVVSCVGSKIPVREEGSGEGGIH